MFRSFLCIVINVVGFALLVPMVSGQEESQTQFFVRKEVHLRAAPDIKSVSLALLEPGTIVTVIRTRLQDQFLHVRTAEGREGWVSAAHLRSTATLELEALVDSFGGGDAVIVEHGRIRVNP